MEPQSEVPKPEPFLHILHCYLEEHLMNSLQDIHLLEQELFSSAQDNIYCMQDFLKKNLD